MKRHSLMKIGVAMLVCSTVIMTPYVALAQGKVSFKISPTTIEDKIEPGTSQSLTMTVTNLGDEHATLYPVARNIARIADNHQPVYMDGPDDNATGLASWVNYDESVLDVAPGAAATLHFRINFPSDARPGSHMAGLFLTQKPPDNLKEGSAVGFDIGAIMHFQILGDIIEKASLREFRTDSTVYGSPKVSFTIQVENKGNTLIRPQGLIDITDMFGKLMTPKPLVNETAYVISPDSTGRYDVVWEPEGFVFGHYQAVVALAIPLVQGGNDSISMVTDFWVLPMNIIGPVLGGLFTFILVVFVLVKLYVRRQLAGLGARSGSSSAAVRNARGISRLAAVSIGLLLAIVVGLIILFFAFA